MEPRRQYMWKRLMITNSSRVARVLTMLLVTGIYQNAKAQGVSVTGESKPEAGKQVSQPAFGIPQAGPGCTSKHGPQEPCGRWVCLTGDNSWEDVPLAKGKHCYNAGQAGQCDGIDVYPDDCIVSTAGAIYPTYYIASVIYVAPGNGSLVDYGTGTTIGTSTSTADSWKNSLQVQASTGLSLGVVSFGMDISFGSDWGGATTTQVDVEETTTTDVKVSSPASDSLNHNYDWIVLFLDPEIDVVTNAGGNPGQVQWGLNLSHATPQVVLVGWLNGALPMPSDVASTLSQHGITTRDYAQMLNADPFANDSTGAGKPDPARFTYATVFPYEPVSGTFTYKINNSYTSSTTQTVSVNYTTGATVSASAVGNSLKVSDSFTWGNSSSQKASTGTSETETLVLSMPSSAYAGPTDVYVYVDTIYKTFMLSFLNPSGKRTSHYAQRRKRF